MTADSPASASPRWFLALGLAALLGFAVLIALKTSASPGGADSSGYLNGARLLAAGQLRTPLRLPPEFGAPAEINRPHFTPLGLVSTPDPTQLAPTYPIGLPLHFAVAARLLGWSVGPRVLIALAAAFSVWLCYLIAREIGLSPALAASGAVMLAAFPVFLFTSLQPLSDTFATAWCLAATWFALRARSRSATLNSAFAGLAVSLAVLVRPTNALYAPAVVILLGLDLRRLLAFAVPCVPAAAAFLWYNQHQYGGPLASGYGDVASAFALHYFAPTAGKFALWLASLLPAIVLVLPFAALAHPATRTRAFLALGVAFIAVTGAYTLYEISQQVWWCLRFILPVIPALLLCALLGVEALARGPAARWPAFRSTTAALLALWGVGVSVVRSPDLQVFMVPHYERIYDDVGRAAPNLLPADALVASFAFSGTLYFYTDFPVIRPDMMERDSFQRYTATARQARRPLCAIVFESEEQRLRDHHAGPWKRLGEIGNVRFLQLE